MNEVTKPGYKHTELGWIPEDWNIVELGDAVFFLDGQRRPIKSQDRSKVSGDYPYYGASGIIDYVNNYLFNDHLILLGEDGENILSRNSPLAFQVKGKIWVNNHAHVLKPKDKYEIGFLTEFLESLDYSLLNSGTAQPKLNKNSCQKIKLLSPPFKEQTAIATALSDMDSYIQSLEALIAKKRLIKHGAMQELLTPKEDWEVRKLGDVFNISGGYSASRDQLSNEGYCYLHYGDIHGSEKSYVNVELEFGDIPKLNIGLAKISSKSLLKNGDIVFVDASEDMDGVSKHIVIENHLEIPFISGLHTIVAKSKTEFLDLNYKKYCFQAKYIKEQFQYFAVGTKVSGISKSSIKQVDFHYPEIKVQREIGSILSSIDIEIQSIGNKLSKALHLKQGMMQELLTGRTRLV